MFPVRPPLVLRSFYRNVVWQMPAGQKVLYLTFDDGPIPEITPWVINQLREFNAKATFFCLGENIKKHTNEFEMLIKEGHATGNHTMNHFNGWFTHDFRYIRNVEICQSVLVKHRGQQEHDVADLFRPPYGKITFSQVKALKRKYKIIMWDVLSFDYDKTKSGEQCYRNVQQYAKPGSIIVFHDSKKAEERLRYALPKVLQYFTEKGYEFKSLQF